MPFLLPDKRASRAALAVTLSRKELLNPGSCHTRKTDNSSLARLCGVALVREKLEARNPKFETNPNDQKA
jgi:hypothetical protein